MLRRTTKVAVGVGDCQSLVRWQLGCLCGALLILNVTATILDNATTHFENNTSTQTTTTTHPPPVTASTTTTKLSPHIHSETNTPPTTTTMTTTTTTTTTTLTPALLQNIATTTTTKATATLPRIVDAHDVPEVKYDVVDVEHGSNYIESQATAGQTTRIYTTGDVNDDFWLKHLGDDFKRAIHLQVGGSEQYNQLLNQTNNGVHEIVEHEYLPGAHIDNLGLSYQAQQMYGRKYAQDSAAGMAPGVVAANDSHSAAAAAAADVASQTFNITVPLTSHEDSQIDATSRTPQSEGPFESIFTLDASGVKVTKNFPTQRKWQIQDENTQITPTKTTTTHTNKIQQHEIQQQQQQQQHIKDSTATYGMTNTQPHVQQQQQQQPPHEQQTQNDRTRQDTEQHTQTHNTHDTQQHMPTQTEHRHTEQHTLNIQQQQQQHIYSLTPYHHHYHHPTITLEDEQRIQQELESTRVASSMLPYYIARPLPSPSLPSHQHTHHTLHQLPFKSPFNAYRQRQQRHIGSLYAPATEYILYRQPWYRR